MKERYIGIVNAHTSQLRKDALVLKIRRKILRLRVLHKMNVYVYHLLNMKYCSQLALKKERFPSFKIQSIGCNIFHHKQELIFKALDFTLILEDHLLPLRLIPSMTLSSDGSLIS
jgi:hypothetical protein